MESVDRNFILQMVHNTKLPSYSVWTEDDIYYKSFPENKQWWVKMSSICEQKELTDENILETIKKWIYIYTLPNEYCSKRFGGESDI